MFMYTRIYITILKNDQKKMSGMSHFWAGHEKTEAKESYSPLENTRPGIPSGETNDFPEQEFKV